MATKKPVAKASKSASAAKKPVKKATPAKPAAKATGKSAPAKAAPKKAAAKPAPKPAAKATKAAPAKAVKPAAKAAPKKATKPVVAPKKPAAKAATVKKAEAPKAAPKAPAKAVAPAPAPRKQDIKPIKTATVAKKKAEEKATPENTAPKAAPKKAEPAKPAKVVIPKTTTNVAVKYEPEFTRSVLDQPQNEPVGPTMRYSDAELNEFRELIGKKLDAARKELTYLQGLITRKDEMGGDNDDARYMTMEDGSMSMEREQLSQMASRQIQFIDHLEKALMRIENKTYGVCRVSGKLIDKARLRAVPHATLSMEAKLGLVKNG
ncbi:MAG: TraR/DksA family transcriptional regulator [Chitinophagaceae bacterium]